MTEFAVPQGGVLNGSPGDIFDSYLALCGEVGADVEYIRDLAPRILDHVKNNTPPPPEFNEVEGRWHESLKGKSGPDWSVYAGDYYLAELWATWIAYSRVYIRTFLSERRVAEKMSFAEYASDVKSVLDLGCGVGLSTAALKEMFPNARVVGTNLEGTRQIEIARRVAKACDFEIMPEAKGQFDMIFASEYFEHLTSPVAHLRTLVNTTTPRLILTANSFHAERAVGHFPCYYIDGEWIAGKDTSRRFMSELRALGFRKFKVRFWNHRPRVWIRGRRAKRKKD